MANDLNQCQFIGRLGQDPEIRYSPDGTAFANISIAVGKSWKNKDTGSKEERTTWVPVVFSGKLAEIVGQYLRKGSKIFVSGEFNVRKWQDQQGNDRYSTEVRVGFNGQMQMLDPPAENQQGRQSAQQQSQQSSRQQSPPQQQQQQTAPQQATRQAQSDPRMGAGAQQQPAPQQSQGFDDFDDDIPF